MNKTEFTFLPGNVTQSHEYYQSHGGGIPATLHQKIWIKTKTGNETHLHIIGNEIPVRKDHKLLALFCEESLVAVINFSSQKYINLVPGWKSSRLEDVFLFLFVCLLLFVSFIFSMTLGFFVLLALVFGITSTRKRKCSTDLHHRVESVICSQIKGES